VWDASTVDPSIKKCMQSDQGHRCNVTRFFLHQLDTASASFINPNPNPNRKPNPNPNPNKNKRDFLKRRKKK
jgi:hypothetical protein